MSDQDEKRTDPELPHVDPQSAPPIELPRPPKLPSDTEARRERPTPAFLSMPEERESLVTAFRNMLEAHEQREVDDRGMLRSEVANLTRRFDQWADNAQVLFGENLRGWLLEDFKEAAREIANPFLEKVEEWLTELRKVKETQMEQGVRLTRLESLRGKVEAMEHELKQVREQLDLLIVRGSIVETP